MKEVQLVTEDNAKLTAHIFEPEKSNEKLLLINSATGVKQQIYFNFAKYFAENGFTVITYDYRGIGLSKPVKMSGASGSMRLWGSEDYKAVTTYLKSAYQSLEWFALGHSVGALILGMNEDSLLSKEFIFVGTQNAFVGNLKFRTKVEATLGFGIAQPLTTALFGYFPAHWFGLGESLPKGSAYDWRTLILNKNSVNKLLRSTPNVSHELRQNVLVIRAEDDTWLTEKGVRSLLNDTYPNLNPTFRLVKKSESSQGEIGHINFFRSYNRNLWSIILERIL